MALKWGSQPLQPWVTEGGELGKVRMDADAPRDENARRTVRPRARRKAGDPCLAVCLLAESSSWEPCSSQSPAHRLLSITGEAGVADGTAAMVTVITGADGTDVAVMAA